MGDRNNDRKAGGRKKLDNIISKLAEHQINKSIENEQSNSDDRNFDNADATSGTERVPVELNRRSKRKPEKALKTNHIEDSLHEAETSLTVVAPAVSDYEIQDDGENIHNITLKDRLKSKRKKTQKHKIDVDDDTDLPKIVYCTACNKCISTSKAGKLCRHPDLNTLICKSCYKFYSSGKFTKDEYGVEEYCRWCADGGDLICCDFCEKAFCKDCIKRNLGKSKLKELLEAGEDEKWHCFCCDPDPISGKILLCNRVMRLLDEKKDQHTPYKDKKGRVVIRGPNQSERRNLLANLTGKQVVKIERLPQTSFSKKTYSKRFQDLEKCKSKNEEQTVETDCADGMSIKEEHDKETDDVTTLLSSDDDMEELIKQNGNRASHSEKKYKPNGKCKSEKSKKVVSASDSDVTAKQRKGKKQRDRKKRKSDVDGSSSDSFAKSRTKSRSKIGKKQRRHKELNSDFEDDFVSMVKKGDKKLKHKKGKQSKNTQRIDSSEESSDETSSGDDSSESPIEKRRKRKGSKTKQEVRSSSEENESTSDFEEARTAIKKSRNKGIKKAKEKGNTRWKLRKKREVSEERDSDEESEKTPKKHKSRKTKGQKDKKRSKRKRKLDSDEEEDTDDDETVSPSKKGRKKIRKILDNNKLEEATRHARKLEEERRKRLVERTKNTVFEKPASADVKEVVLEYDEDKAPLVQVDHDLVKHLKPHQVEGVKFMYDCTIESVKSWGGKEEGGGCILAHVMGLGKTLQVVALVHTLYRSDDIKLRRVLVVCPLNTVLNWQGEFEKWLSVDDRLDVYVLNEAGSNNWNRADMMKNWHNHGGVLIMGYTMYRNLSQCVRVKSKHQKKIFKESLVDPGPELVVCDEGHVLRNCKSAISMAMNSIRTKRRIVLTGTPLQNNLMEYHCMVSFVKPSLLGTLKEFSNSFINPIQNGQCADSTELDVRLMKRRCHVLHKMLEGCVQRKDYADIAQFLPPKLEYVIKIRLTEKQRELYKYYLDTFLTTNEENQTRGGSLFSDYQALMRIWTHPWALKLDSARQAEKFLDTDDSMGDFVVDSDEEENVSSSEEASWTSDSSSEGERRGRRRRRWADSSETSSSSEHSAAEDAAGDVDDSANDGASSVVEVSEQSNTKKNVRKVKSEPDEPATTSVIAIDEDVEMDNKKAAAGTTEAQDCQKKNNTDSIEVSTLRSGQEYKENVFEEEWYDKFLSEEDETNVEIGSKIVLLLEILADAAALDEKVLVFSHSLISLDLIEMALGGGKIGGNAEDWCRGCDYFRMDGSTSAQMRKRWSDIFNDEENKAARLFLISTKAGGLGINLIGASRVVVFDISWNPSHDVQSIFRTYRFGQNKPVFVYRFIAEGTMEEKIYDRQVTKLSVSQRVVDEHQIERHFNANDLAELYRFEPDVLENENVERSTPVVPKDPILAELINRLYPKWIVKYHEHDSLLRNRPEEELTEAERKEAWENYEAEKRGLNRPNPDVQNGVNGFSVGFVNPNAINAGNFGVPNLGMPTGIRYATPSTSAGLVTVPNHAAELQRAMNAQLQYRQQQEQRQRVVLEEQRRRLFEFERQRAQEQLRREEELRKRQEVLRQMEIRRQEEIRRQAREREVAEERRQQQASQQFLQQLLRNRNQSAYVTQQTGARGYPGQSVYRVVVNNNPRPQAPRRSPPRIIELPPDA